MGAADCVEVRPRTVIVTQLRSLTWPNLGNQVVCPAVCSVHTEEVAGSIPVSPTQLTGRFRTTDRPFLISRQTREGLARTV